MSSMSDRRSANVEALWLPRDRPTCHIKGFVSRLSTFLARPLTLCYHATSDTWPHQLSLPQAVIEKQVGLFLRRGFRPARAAEIVQGRGRLLHVTFDDAFASSASTIVRLADLGIASTVFVCTGLADRAGAPLAVDELEQELRARPNELTTLSWGDLAELSSGITVEIGSHTVSHARLWELTDHELDKELRESKASIEDHTGRPCRYLAYPFGRADERSIRAARRAGYEAAFLLLNGRWDECYALPRVDLYPPDRGWRLLLKTEPVISLRIAALRRRTRLGRAFRRE
jgi:peptidoglycan/xylan/chitin deacetylase (PgdA/CDA1 family)